MRLSERRSLKMCIKNMCFISTTLLTQSSQRTQVYAFRRSCPQRSQACQYFTRLRLPGKTSRFWTCKIGCLNESRIRRSRDDRICCYSMVQGPWNSSWFLKLHQSRRYVVSGLHSGRNVHREGNFPRHFNLESNIKSSWIVRKAISWWYWLNGICHGKGMHQPN